MEEYRDLESLNDHLLDWCDGERRRKGEKWNREREALRPPPAEPPESLKGYRIAVPEPGIYDRLGRMHS